MKIELCPETGMCSIVKDDGKKVDLMPDEVNQIKEASGNAEKIKGVIADADDDFAGKLSADEIARISEKIK